MNLSLSVMLAVLAAGIPSLIAAEPPYRPEAGKFPSAEKGYAYQGELVFVDHVNRRGSLRVTSTGTGTFHRNEPHPFALLPYGMVRLTDAPADIRDVPLGTLLHVLGYLPPDPKLSSVPVLPVNNKDVDANHYRGTGVFPAENHALLVEDEPSYCRRLGLVWKLDELTIKERQGLLTARREAKSGGETKAPQDKFTFDAATRVWRGRERLTIADLVAEGIWPADGKKALADQAVHLGLTWKPTPEGIFTRLHIADIWLDDASLQSAARAQTEVHKAFMRSRWLPAVVDSVEYGKFGRATVTATLFGGMDPSLYEDFKEGVTLIMNGAENTLKHASGNYGPAHIASKGPLVSVTRTTSAPLGSSGIQVRFETDLIIEGIRPTRIVRVRPATWTAVYLPREECLWDNNASHEMRFPSPAIFPKY